jgi:hypothetical protein
MSLPTTFELSIIAATLARNSNVAPEDLSENALKLWYSAEKTIHLNHIGEILFEEQELPPIPNDDNCPFAPSEPLFFPPIQGESTIPVITRDKFLETVLPQWADRPDELKRFALIFIGDYLRAKNRKDVTQDKVEAAYTKWKTFEKIENAEAFAREFTSWFKQYKINNKRFAGKLSAAARAEKKSKNANGATTSPKPKKTRKARPPFDQFKNVLLTLD